MKGLGAMIRDHRERKGMSLRKLATAVRVSCTYMTHIEQGVMTPSPDRIKELAEILGCDFETMMDESGKWGDFAKSCVNDDPRFAAEFKKLWREYR